MTPDFPYVQLPGAYRGFFRKASLWEGIDHILSVSGTRFNDEYRRFYYRDIQAIIVEKRPRAGSWGWWSVFLVALIVAGVASFGGNEAYSWVAFIILLLVIIVRLEFTFRRSCRCSVQTAVSREYLPSLIRTKDAERAIQRLQTRIAAEQGELPMEIPSSTNDAAAFVLPPDPTRRSSDQMLRDAAIGESRESAIRGVNFAVVTFFVLLLNSVFTFWISSGNRLTLPVSSSVLAYSFIALGLIPASLSLQSLAGLEPSKALRVLLISILVLGLLRFVLSWLIGPILSAVVSSKGASFIPVFNRSYTNINGGLQLVLATGGLILIFAKWEEYRRGEASTN